MDSSGIEAANASSQEKGLLTREEIHAIDTLYANRSFKDNRYEVGLTFKARPEGLYNNCSNAEKQFRQLEKRFSKDPGYAERYKTAMQVYFDLDHVKPAPQPLHNNEGYFMHHSAVQ